MSGERMHGRDLHSSPEALPPIITAWFGRTSADAAVAGEPLPPYRPDRYGIEDRSVEAPGTHWSAGPERAEASAAAATEFPWDASAGAGAGAVDEADEPVAPLPAEEAIERSQDPWGEPEADRESVGAEPAGDIEGTVDGSDDPYHAVDPGRPGDIQEPAAAWESTPEPSDAFPSASERGPSDELEAERPSASQEPSDAPEATWYGESVDAPGIAEAEWSAVPEAESADAPGIAEAEWSAVSDAESADAPEIADAEWSAVSDAEPGEESASTRFDEPASEFPWDIEPPVLAPTAEMKAPEPVDEAEDAFAAGADAGETDRESADAPAAASAAPEAAGERIHFVPPTPLDDWFHGPPMEGAATTWEAFGRALEESASWGDLAAAIATGQPASGTTGEASKGEERAGQPAAGAADPGLLDLARRLEALARRIRDEGEGAVGQAIAEGDRLDGALAGFIAGYVAARRG